MVVPYLREHELAMEGRRRLTEDYVMELAGMMMAGEELTKPELEKLAQLSGEYVAECKDFERACEVEAERQDGTKRS